MRERLAEVLNLEVLFLVCSLWVLSFLFYTLFLRDLPPHRHVRMRGLFKDSLTSFIGFGVLYCAHSFFQNHTDHLKTEHYVGIAALFLGAYFLVRVCKIVVFEYLFFSNMREGVPVLLVNMVTLVVSIFLLAWMLTTVFAVHIAPLLATSALLSVVLGLALQDTLGNLFAGVALQFDKPYEIGDWIEIQTETKSVVGIVQEITWRATVLNGFFDEVITLPNRLISQSEVTNYSGRSKPVYHGFSLYLEAAADPEKVRTGLSEIIQSATGVVHDRPHFVMLRELNEKGAHWRVAFAIEQYGRLYLVQDEILTRIQGFLAKEKIKLAQIRIDSRSQMVSAEKLAQ